MGSGQHFLELDASSALNFTYAMLVAPLSIEERQKIDKMLAPNRWDHTKDERLPERLRKMVRPPWWDGDADPMASTFTVG